jgi:hypothetical protein
MEHTEEADFRSETFRRPSDFEQGFGAGPEQEIVDDLLVLQGQRGEPMRKREDDMDVASGQELLTARLDPTVAGVGLALGTMPITAAVVRDDVMPAAGTLIQVSA